MTPALILVVSASMAQVPSTGTTASLRAAPHVLEVAYQTHADPTTPERGLATWTVKTTSDGSRGWTVIQVESPRPAFEPNHDENGQVILDQLHSTAYVTDIPAADRRICRVQQQWLVGPEDVVPGKQSKTHIQGGTETDLVHRWVWTLLGDASVARGHAPRQSGTFPGVPLARHGELEAGGITMVADATRFEARFDEAVKVEAEAAMAACDGVPLLRFRLGQ